QSSKCFKFFGVKDENKLAWTDARDACKKVGTNGDLASVSSEIEQLLLSTMLTNKRFNVWIGLSRLSSTGLLTRTFGWTDNTRIFYVNWAPGSPSSFWKRCVTMLGSPVRAGRWIDSSCSEKQGYVCQQPKDKKLPEQDINYNCNGSLTNYVSYDNGCYQVFDELNSKKTWKDAEDYCRKVKGHLASVMNPYEQAFLHLLLKKSRSKVWIGFGSKIVSFHL
ncbi:macrophage mannose receptor 1-like, partial [Limulus polyphemus]|uniref:Macrophage mannose receptor 1-like n=1 Tax=Limulus polyphemus TaxID=6850 RepID=A0ABM1RYG7_LIMPO